MENEKKLQDWTLSDLKKSGLSDEIIDEMMIEDVKDREHLTSLIGFAYIDKLSILQATSCYYIPYINAVDEKTFGRVKLQFPIPLVEDGKPAKYLSPSGNHTLHTTHLYILQGESKKLGKTSHPLFIVEGEKKTAKLAQELRKYKPECAVVGIGGVSMWQNCPEWKDVSTSCRKVYIVFDSDWQTNPQIQTQMVKLFLYLRKKMANISFISFDRGKGIDDHLVTCESIGLNMSQEIESLISCSGVDSSIWTTNLNYQKMANICAESYYSIDTDCKALWEEQELEKLYKIKWRTFKAALKLAYKQRIEKETKEVSSSNSAIIIDGGTINIQVNKVQDLMANENLIFQRNGIMVRPIKDAPMPGVERDKDTVTIFPVEPLYLVKLFTEKMRWLKFNKFDNKYERVDCPEMVAKMYMADRPWKLPVLTGILMAPTLRRDGSILQQPGYDKQTGLMFLPNIEFPPIPENPTRNDAIEALEKLKVVFEEFPFESEMDMSVMLSAVLTVCIRKSIRTAPMFLISAPKQASGKSLLATVVSLIATGCSPTMINQSKNSEEDEKLLFTLLLDGDPIICIDNVEKPVGFEALCTTLTEDFLTKRILGFSQRTTISTVATFFATGNNISVRGDISSRTLICTIDAQCEKPEERKFKLNLREYIPKHRGELVQAALTVLRAYHVAGRPKLDIPAYRLEEWNDWVRNSLIWAGMPDPCETRAKVEENDLIRSNIKLLLDNWYASIQEPITVKDLISLAESPGRESLKDAILEVAEDKNKSIDKKKLGYFLRSIKGRWEGGKRLESCGTSKHGGFTMFKVVKK